MRDTCDDIRILERGSSCVLVAGSIFDVGRIRDGAKLFDLAFKCLIALPSVKVFQIEPSSPNANQGRQPHALAAGR